MYMFKHLQTAYKFSCATRLYMACTDFIAALCVPHIYARKVSTAAVPHGIPMLILCTERGLACMHIACSAAAASTCLCKHSLDYLCKVHNPQVSSGHVTKLGPSRLYTAVAPSPDGEYLLVAWLERPFSYNVPCGRFPKRIQLWDK